jgi:FkbM family methyltransferase
MTIKNVFSFVFRKRLPKQLGSGAIYVSPRADMRVLYPGWNKCAGDLLIVAKQNVKPGAVVWDIGGNLGIFSVFAASQAGATGRVYALEPDPYYATLIARTAARLGHTFAPLQILCAAASDKIGITWFSISAQGHARSSLTLLGRNKDGLQRPTVTITLDMLLAEWAHPDVVKVDVEGAEILLLEGAKYLLREVRPIVYIEVSEENESEAARIFRENNYRLFRLNGGNEEEVTYPGMYTIARPI